MHGTVLRHSAFLSAVPVRSVHDEAHFSKFQRSRHVRCGSKADMPWSNHDVRFTPESGHRVAADTDARTAWRFGCIEFQTLLTVLGAMFRFSNCEKAILYARIAD